MKGRRFVDVTTSSGTVHSDEESEGDHHRRQIRHG